MNIVELEYENIQLRDENQKLINENKVLKHKLGETQIDLAMKEIQSRVPKIELNVSPNSPNADQIALIVQENMRLRCENRQLNQMNIHLKIEINDLKYRLKTVEADQKELKGNENTQEYNIIFSKVIIFFKIYQQRNHQVVEKREGYGE